MSDEVAQAQEQGVVAEAACLDHHGKGESAGQGSADDAGFGFVEQVDAGGAKGLEHRGGRFSPGDDECVDRVVLGQRLYDCGLRTGEFLCGLWRVAFIGCLQGEDGGRHAAQRLHSRGRIDADGDTLDVHPGVQLGQLPPGRRVGAADHDQWTSGRRQGGR
ncbi:hypothetical protein GCM10018780_03280 [Streptomyces lanatus]|nr:hypothetical protein [Streptomyces lanatus]GHG86490.1 hypothetical protein GCM10018780_03280 [Streptomyces lanatus]